MVEAFWVQPGTCWNLVWTLTTLPRRKMVYVCNPGWYSLIQKYIVNRPGSSKYAKILPFGRFFLAKRHKYIIHPRDESAFWVLGNSHNMFPRRTWTYPLKRDHFRIFEEEDLSSNHQFLGDLFVSGGTYAIMRNFYPRGKTGNLENLPWKHSIAIVGAYPTISGWSLFFKMLRRASKSYTLPLMVISGNMILFPDDNDTDVNEVFVLHISNTHKPKATFQETNTPNVPNI